jgi:hypothetical protein
MEVNLMPKPKQASGRFLKKAPQKLFCSPGDVAKSRVKFTKVFCGTFLQKSDLLLSLAFSQVCLRNVQKLASILCISVYMTGR